ncbi:hypothetical protein EVAR_29169_1 [Eumeta japonica]|uniref:Uncharacterized protein n=1 Tax=Eumeta variegata TaxID=151549 RepID=A0A4C1VBN5_EUMVA|nr:hypothetical protein EVAR_29169_1 [Eumeta japonica]
MPMLYDMYCSTVLDPGTAFVEPCQQLRYAILHGVDVFMLYAAPRKAPSIVVVCKHDSFVVSIRGLSVGKRLDHENSPPPMKIARDGGYRGDKSYRTFSCEVAYILPG